MSAAMVLLDPTSEQSPVARALTARPPSLRGLAVALLDISKPRGNVLLDRIAELLQAQGKPTFTRPAPTELRQQIAAENQLVIEGLAD